MMDNNGDTHDRQSADQNAELAALRRKLDRAETATRAAESLLEEKSSALYQANRELHQNKERLERLVFERTAALNDKIMELESLRDRLRHDRDSALAESANKSMMFAKLSHEIRTPLNGVIGTLNMLADSELGTAQEQILGTALKSCDLLRYVLNDAIDLAKLEQGLVPLETAPFDLHAMADEIADFWRASGLGSGQSLAVSTDPAIGHLVVGDAGRIRQILNNLVSNAVKYGGDGGIELAGRVIRQDDASITLALSVTDPGETIPPGEREDLFQAYRRGPVKGDQGVGSGAGLGLAICRELSDLMQARIGCAPANGGGNRFTLEITLDKGDARRPVASPAATDRPKGGTLKRLGTGKRPRILVVEDVATNQLVMEHYLRKLGCRVDLAANGLEGVEAVQDRSYDVIMMDIAMPIMDGLQATKVIKSLGGEKSAIPIIGVSAHVSQEDQQRMHDAGMMDCLPKPIDRQRLEHILVAIVEAGDTGQDRASAAAPGQDPGQNIGQNIGQDLVQGLRRTPPAHDEQTAHTPSPGLMNSGISLDDDSAIADLLAAHFKADMAAAMAQARAALEQRDASELLSGLHKLKGLTGSFDHPAYPDVADLHDLVKEQGLDVPDADIAGLLDRL